MNFKKDLLLIDLETTGLDSERHEIIQIAAILLDKKTLKEKSSFNSYTKPKKWENRDPKAMAVNKIKKEWLEPAPSLKTVLTSFDRKFQPRNVLQAFYVGWNDKRFLLEGYKKNGLKWKFDYHYFDVWAFCFAVLGKNNQLTSNKDFGGFSLEQMSKKLKINFGTLHDALTDCRVEAELLRKVLYKI